MVSLVLRAIRIPLALLLGACSVSAGTNHFVVPAFRGQPNSEFGLWERFTLAFGTTDSSLSLDAITIDTWSGFQAVPEPSSFALVVGGGLVLMTARPRRRG